MRPNLPSRSGKARFAKCNRIVHRDGTTIAPRPALIVGRKQMHGGPGRLQMIMSHHRPIDCSGCVLAQGAPVEGPEKVAKWVAHEFALYHRWRWAESPAASG